MSGIETYAWIFPQQQCWTEVSIEIKTENTHTHTMIKGHCVDNIEFAEIILVWGIIAMPGNNIKGGVALQGRTLNFDEE